MQVKRFFNSIKSEFCNGKIIRNYYAHKRLHHVDPEMYDLIQCEKHRQKYSLNLIASENYCSLATLDTLGSCLINKYSEGYPGKRYYAGNYYIDKIELLVQKRALQLFDLNPEEWGVNVQPYSGSIANFAVYTALLQPHDRIMGLDLTHGGHLSHGYLNKRKSVSVSSIFFESLSYRLNKKTELIDYDELEKLAQQFFPKIIIAGASAYSRLIDYSRIKQICDKVGAILLTDIAHISGLVATKLIPSPFPHSDIVTTTTQKLLRSSRGALIFYRRKINTSSISKTENTNVDFENKINRAVFPSIQGGPQVNTIASIGVSLKEAMNSDFYQYQKKVLSNAKVLCEELINHGFRIVSGGTDNHLCIVDLKPQNIKGDLAEHILEQVSIVVNKNTCPDDCSPMSPSGIRLGAPALTSRKLQESHFKIVADFIAKTLNIAQFIIRESNATCIAEFDEFMLSNSKYTSNLEEIKRDVESFASSFPIP